MMVSYRNYVYGLLARISMFFPEWSQTHSPGAGHTRDPTKSDQSGFHNHLEPLMRIELTTSSLPRKCSTTELQRLLAAVAALSGRRGSNPRPIAWKAIALPTELLPQCILVKKFKPNPKNVGRSGFEPLKSKDSGFTVRPIWPLWNLPPLVNT